jgi:hypothetical protein
VRNVVAQKPHGKHAAATRAHDPRRCVQGEHVKAHGIARLKLPAEDGKVVTSCFNIRQIARMRPRETT